jgi:hypothetical protein
MAPGHYVPDQDFAPAAAGTRVRIVTLLCFVAVIGAAVANLVLALRHRHPGPWLSVAAVGGGLAFLVVVWFTARIRGYRLAAAELQVHRPLLIVRFPLEGLQEAVPDRDALRGARKIVGNDGLGAISGRYRSKRLGRFQAYLTDREHAVVLRWPDRSLVVSPDQTAWFIETVRRRAGLTPPR